jgi:hypothetical protein
VVLDGTKRQVVLEHFTCPGLKHCQLLSKAAEIVVLSCPVLGLKRSKLHVV